VAAHAEGDSLRPAVLASIAFVGTVGEIVSLGRVSMTKQCPSCGVTVADQIRCPLCDASLVKVNLRRVLLWAIVMEEYFLLSVAIVRRGLSLL
jgi:hypothetical protein